MEHSKSSYPQEWSSTQREVWKCLIDHWERLVKGNIDEFLEYIHPDFIGFGHESPLSLDKKWLESWVGFWGQSTTIPIHYHQPIRITIHGSIAIVQYYIFTIEKSDVDKGKRVARRYTMTWMKQKDTWVVIGSHNNLMNDT